MKRIGTTGYFDARQWGRVIRTMILTAVITYAVYFAAGYTSADDRTIPLYSLAPSVSAENSNADALPAVKAAPLSNIPEEPVWQTVRMRVTAYCTCSICCGRSADGITASQYKIRPGDKFVAADRKFRFGTRMIVPGYNGGNPIKVLDRGGKIRGDRLDVFFPSHRVAKKWGVRYLDVQVRE